MAARPFDHAHVALSTGINMHVVTSFPSPKSKVHGTIIMVHGFPDTSHGWRLVMNPLAELGWIVRAVDMRGYGSTTFADGVQKGRPASDYRTEALCDDIVALMDALKLERAVLLGHDWGGTVVWNFATHPALARRLRAVAVFCTPFFPNKPTVNPMENMMKNPGRFDYQLYFQSDEAIEEFDRDVERTVRVMQRRFDAPLTQEALVGLATPRASKGLMSGFPLTDGGVKLEHTSLTPEDLRYLGSQFRQSGFEGPIKWYRNVLTNWEWNKRTAGMGVDVPALMVTAEQDSILTPSMTKGMENYVHHLELANVENAGHWVLQERPDMCVAYLKRFLERLVEAEQRTEARL